jgi:hypothetical protein
MRSTLAVNRGQVLVREATITDQWGRTYQGWLAVRKTPYLHDWPADVSGHKVGLDRRLPWQIR